MLQGDFFTIGNIEITGFNIKATLVINASHKIFNGHFPGQPVVPGVCMLQMVKEIMEQVTEKKTDLIKSSEIKFLAVIDPSQNNNISASLKYTIDDNQNIIVAAALFKDELIHFKFKGLFSFQKQAS